VKTMKAIRWCLVLHLGLLIVLSSSSALLAKGSPGSELPPTKQTMRCVGFSADGKEAVFHVIDENIGTLFQVRSLKKNEIVASYPFDPDGEKRAWRRVKKAHKVSDDFNDAPENTKKKVVMMSQVKGDNIRILMMRGDRIKPYTEIALHKNKKGKPAESFVKQMLWNPKGKIGVVVYHQKTKGRMVWEGDFVHSFKFKSYRVDFGEDDAK